MRTSITIMRGAFLLLPVILITRFFSIAQSWTPCNKPEGGTIQCIDTFGGYLWVGTLDGGVYKSNDYGMTWQRANNGLPHDAFNLNIYCFKRNQGKFFIGNQAGMFQISNPTDPWAPVANFPYWGGGPKQIAVINNVLFALQYGNVLRSSDNGQTWQNCSGIGLPAQNNYAGTSLVAVQGKLILNIIGANSGLYVSADTGATWSHLGLPVGIPPTASSQFLKVMGNRLFTSFYGHGIFYTDDVGQNWDNSLASGSEFGYQVDIDMAGGMYVISSNTGIMTHAANWTFCLQNLSRPLPITNYFLKYGSYLFIGTAGEGMLRIDTALNHFDIIRNGLIASHTIYMGGNGNRVAAYVKLQKEFWTSTDNGVTWTGDSMTNYFLNEVTSQTVNGNKWYTGLLGGINMTTDNGQHWQYVVDGLHDKDIWAMVTTNNNLVLAGADSGQIFKCVNDTSWTMYGPALPDSGMVTKLVKAGTYLYAVSAYSIPSGQATNLYRSSDNGQTWQVNNSWGSPAQVITALAYDGHRLILGKSGYGTWYSNDFGQTWDSVNTGLPQYNVFRDMKVFNGTVYACRDVEDGLYTLDSGSYAWQCQTCDSTDPNAISVWVTDSAIFVGTADNGVWKKAFSQQQTAITQLKTQTSYILYPNPGIAPVLRIAPVELVLPATITITDAVGKIVKRDVMTTFTQSIDGRQLKAGLYFINVHDASGREISIKWQKP